MPSASTEFREPSSAPLLVSELFQQSFYLYTHCPFQNKQPAGMIQTSVQHTVKMQLPSRTRALHQGADWVQQKGYENYLITGIPAAPVCLCDCRCTSCLAGVGLSLPRLSLLSPELWRQLCRVMIGRNSQFLQLIILKTFKDLKLLWCHPVSGILHMNTFQQKLIQPPAAFPLTQHWLIGCSLRICIIFHCTVGILNAKSEYNIPLCSYDTVSTVVVG